MDRSQGVGHTRSRNGRTEDAHKPKDQPRKRRRTIGFMPLEPRIMYDGAAAASAAAAHHHEAHHDFAVSGGPESPVASPPSAPVEGSPRHHDATPAEPMPQVLTWVKDPTEIVFIDQQVPDWQLLASGVNPGIEVVILNPNTDGVEQIADFLSSHPDPNLTTVDIVAHGQDGMLFLGNAVLDNDTVGQYAAQLQTIGAAVQPGGDLMLYGCDVAADPTGIILLAQITDETGLNVAASTGPIGSAAEGGTWTLNATSGVIDATVPFTAATLAAYPDVLNADLTDVFAIINDGSTGDGIIYGTNTGTGSGLSSGPTTEPFSSSFSSTQGGPFQIQLDTQDGLYFVLVESDDLSHPAEILEGSLSQVLSGTTPTFTTIYKSSTVNDQIDAFQVDVADNLIYMNYITNNFSGVTYSDEFDAITFTGAHFTGSASVVTVGTEDQQAFTSMVVDPTHKAVYFAETSFFSTGNTANGGELGIIGQNQLFKATWAGTNASPTNFTFGLLPIAPADGTLGNNNLPTSLGEIGALALDPTNQILYFDTDSINGSTSGIFSYALSGTGTDNSGVWSGSGAYTEFYTQSQSAVPGGFQPGSGDFVVDPLTGKYYVSVLNGTTLDDNAIYEGTIGSSAAPTVLITVNTSSSDRALGPDGLAIDNAPVLTASSHTTPTAVQDGAAVTVDSGITVTDSDNTDLSTLSSPPAATVQITSNFETGDKLTIGGDTSGTLDSGAISYSFSGSTLTLTGTATVAEFQAALQEVQFSTTSGVSTAARTITFTASDGVLSGSVTDTVDVDVLPTIGATGNTVEFYQHQGSTGTVLDSGITVTDSSGADITNASVTIGSPLSGDELVIPTADLSGNTIIGTSITVSGNDSATLTLSGSDTAAHYQEALRDVTYDFSGDPTNAGADKTRTITWSVTDADSLTSASGSSTTLDVFMTPALAAGTGFTVPTVTSTSGAVTADPDLAVTDHNTIGSTPVATVTVSSGAQTGDELSIASSDLTGTGITVTGNDSTALTLTGTSSTTAAQFATVLEEVQFDATNPHSGPRTLTWSFNDDAGGNTSDSNSLTTTVDVAFGPTISDTGNSAQYYQSQGSTATTLDSGITVTDAADISGATVTISSVYLSGDTLTFNNGSNTETFSDSSTITATQSGDVLTLTTTSGNATASDYTTALESVAYSFSGDPTSAGTDKTRTITWAVTDANSQTSASGSTSTLDVYASPIVSVGTFTTPTVTASSGAVTADPAVSVTDYNGTTLAGAAVVISSGAQTGDTLTDDGVSTGGLVPGTSIHATFNSGTDTLTLSGTDTVTDYNTALEEVQFDAVSPNSGTRTLTWTVNDEAGGNTNNSTGVTTQADAAFGPLITTLVGQPINGGTVELEGTGVTSGDTIELYADGGSTVVGTGTVSAGGTFDITTTQDFADSVHTFTAVETSNPSLPASPAFTVDVDPNTPAITAVVGQPVNGGTVELQGTGEVGDTIDLYADGGATIVGTGTVGAGGTFDITTSATFADAVHTFTATETDSSSLTSTASTPAFSVNVDPNTPAITAVVGQPVNGGTVELQGTGEVGDTIDLYADGGATIVGTGTVGAGGTFDITTSATFTDAVHTFTATDTDAASLTSTASTPAFTVDVDPNAPAITAVVGQPVNGQDVTVTGTGETVGDTITLYNGATVIGTGTVGSGGTFSVTTTSTFADGVYSFTATETDVSSLTSAKSSPLTVG